MTHCRGCYHLGGTRQGYRLFCGMGGDTPPKLLTALERYHNVFIYTYNTRRTMKRLLLAIMVIAAIVVVPAVAGSTEPYIANQNFAISVVKEQLGRTIQPSYLPNKYAFESNAALNFSGNPDKVLAWVNSKPWVIASMQDGKYLGPYQPSVVPITTPKPVETPTYTKANFMYREYWHFTAVQREPVFEYRYNIVGDTKPITPEQAGQVIARMYTDALNAPVPVDLSRLKFTYDPTAQYGQEGTLIFSAPPAGMMQDILDGNKGGAFGGGWWYAQDPCKQSTLLYIQPVTPNVPVPETQAKLFSTLVKWTTWTNIAFAGGVEEERDLILPDNIGCYYVITTNSCTGNSDRVVHLRQSRADPLFNWVFDRIDQQMKYIPGSDDYAWWTIGLPGFNTYPQTPLFYYDDDYPPILKLRPAYAKDVAAYNDALLNRNENRIGVTDSRTCPGVNNHTVEWRAANPTNNHRYCYDPISGYYLDNTGGGVWKDPLHLGGGEAYADAPTKIQPIRRDEPQTVESQEANEAVFRTIGDTRTADIYHRLAEATKAKDAALYIAMHPNWGPRWCWEQTDGGCPGGICPNNPAAGSPLTIAPATVQVSTPVSTDVESWVFTYTNDARVKAGLPAYTRDPLLTSIAAYHSTDMITNGYFAHNSPNGETPWQRAQRFGWGMRGFSENCGRVQNYGSMTGQAIARNIVDGFINSPGHKANLLDASKMKIGLGVGINATTCVVTQNFG